MLDKEIVIFGGSFDPPHVGHQLVCFWLQESLGAKSLKVVPTFKHSFGKDLAPFEHRLEMCRLMTNRIGVADVNNYEEKMPLPNISYNLLSHYHRLYNAEFVFVIGSDCLRDMYKWDKHEELPKLAKVLVIDRPGVDFVEAPFDVMRYSLNISPTSSTEIRNKLAVGESIEGLVPAKVKDYIFEHGLYGAKSEKR